MIRYRTIIKVITAPVTTQSRPIETMPDLEWRRHWSLTHKFLIGLILILDIGCLKPFANGLFSIFNCVIYFNCNNLIYETYRPCKSLPYHFDMQSLL